MGVGGHLHSGVAMTHGTMVARRKWQCGSSADAVCQLEARMEKGVGGVAQATDVKALGGPRPGQEKEKGRKEGPFGKKEREGKGREMKREKERMGWVSAQARFGFCNFLFLFLLLSNSNF